MPVTDANLQFLASAARTASANGAAINFGGGAAPGLLCATVNVTAVSGTSPALSVEIETSADGSTWVAGPGSGIINAVGSYCILFTVPPSRPQARAAVVISGTSPSFTFSVDVSPKSA